MEQIEAMKVKVFKTPLAEILPLRALFLRENNFQIRYNACHERNWSDSYLISVDDKNIGYGSIKGKEELNERDSIFEFYLLPAYRIHSNRIFTEFISSSGAIYIESQSNEKQLTALLYEFTCEVIAEVILFEDHITTHHSFSHLVFRKRRKDDPVFEATEEMGQYVLEKEGEILASGGFLLHYNMPFADLYMEVREDARNQGLGCYILQEIKKECYLAGRIPAARCHISNPASRGALLKAGLKECGFMLSGKIRRLNTPE